MRTRLERNLQQMALCVYSIPSVCGRSYIGKTGRPLAWNTGTAVDRNIIDITYSDLHNRI